MGNLNIDPVRMKAFLRGELTRQDLFGNMNTGDFDIVLPEEYRITFEDVLHALHIFQEQKLTYNQIYTNWYNDIVALADDIGLPEAAGCGNMMFRFIDMDEALGRIPFSREAALLDVMSLLYQMPLADGGSFDAEADLDECIEMMENILYNEERPIYDWKLTMIQKMKYAMYLFDHEQIDLVDQPHRDLFRRCVDDACEEGIYDAMRIKAFCSYGGCSVYPCDWELAREYFEILTDEVEDAMAANALGYIYYYGRCSEGVPDYDLAFRYFALGAFAGVYESMYKTADMLAEGQGVPRNTTAAMNQVRFVYSHTKTPFTEGIYSIAFADAALRMGDYHRDGIGTEPDQMLAYSYYLDASLAIRLRMQYDKSYGDDTVYENIQKALADMEKKLGKFVHESSSRMHDPALIDRMLSGGYALQMQIEKNEKDEVILVFERPEHDPQKKILLTIENMSYSALKDKVVLTAEDFSGRSLQPGMSVTFDRIGYDIDTGETIFYDRGNEAGRIFADAFVFEDDRPQGWQSEETLDFVRVLIPDLQEQYDYICPLPGLKRGDDVLVETKYGTKQGTVVSTFICRLSEMPGKPETYKPVLQKIMVQRLS